MSFIIIGSRRIFPVAKFLSSIFLFLGGRGWKGVGSSPGTNADLAVTPVFLETKHFPLYLAASDTPGYKVLE